MPNQGERLRTALDEEWVELLSREQRTLRDLQQTRQDYLTRRAALVGLLGPVAAAIRLSARPSATGHE